MNNKSAILYESIGNNIKKMRKIKKLGQQDLAEKISLSRSSLSNIEIGNHQPSIYTIYEIILALECKIEDILPSLEIYKTSTIIDKEYLDVYNSLPESISEKDLIILREFLKKD